ncbi:MAG: hypothetical protein RBT35_07475 [Bacteroidales bacterium]|jgi:hypothetical protein|nr:hypothetical protein [Bacteroidales bacterium]
MLIIDANEISIWGRRTNSRILLSHFIEQMILSGHNLSTDIKLIRFGHPDQHGWDGVLDFSGTSPWIPGGRSVWELSVNQGTNAKIRSDFNNKIDSLLPGGFNRKNTTYIAVTTCKIQKINKLEDELRERNIYKDVKVFDATTISEWIKVNIPLRLWFQREINKSERGVSLIGQYWEAWRNFTIPVINSELLLANRRDNVIELYDSLKHKDKVTTLLSDSPDESVAFIYSAIDSCDDLDEKESMLSKTIVISSDQVLLDQFKRVEQSLNIILVPPVTDVVNVLINYGHKVICAVGNSLSRNPVTIKLKRSVVSEFTASLVNMGNSPEESEKQARICGCSASIWMIWNILENSPYLGNHIPDWAQGELADSSVVAALIGGWDHSNEADRKIVEELLNISYEDFAGKIARASKCDNPLLTISGEIRIVTAPPVAFKLLQEKITLEHLKAIEIISKRIFSEIDPALGFSSDERLIALLQGIVLSQSKWLRDGIAGTLLRIAVLGENLIKSGAIPDQLNHQQYVDRLIRNLEGLKNDSRLLVSLREQLPIIAEAAPVPFLDALDSLLQGDPNNITSIFDEGTGFFAESLQCGLLWALETLAWSPDYLDRVTIILTKLATLDPGGTFSNRPINSLREIYLSWHPGTNTNLQHRLAAFDRVLEEDEYIGWELLTLLLDRTPQMSSQTRKPVWKDFGRNERDLVTNKIHFEAILHYLEKAFDLADMDPQRWKLLVDLYSAVDEKKQNSISERLMNIANSDLYEEKRIQFWKILRNEVNRNLGFPDAPWAVKKEKIVPLQYALEAFSPKNLIDRISWLFDSYHPDIPFAHSDTEKYYNQTYKMRESEVKKLFEKENTSGIIRLVNQVRFPGLVAHSLKNILTDIRGYESLLIQTNAGSEKESDFASELSSDAYKQFGKQWIELILGLSENQKWSPADIANALIKIPDELEVFKIIDVFNRDISGEYWRKRDGILGTNENEAVKYAAKKLNEYGRSIASLNAIDQSFDLFMPKFVLELLSNSISELNSGESPDSIHNLRYLFENAFKWLYKHKDSYRNEIAQMEYAYIPILTRPFEKKSLVLHEIMNREPEFFIKLICDIYRPESERGEQKNDFSEEEQNMAKLSFHILDAWSTPPGIDVEGNVDPESLKTWTKKARILAKESDRLGIADQEIGKALFSFPADPKDALWPHKVMREIIEDLKSEDLEIGIEFECFNSRGVVSKAAYEGGDRERKIAQEWESKAKSLGHKWPRTREMLMRIAENWKNHAKKADERAQQDRFDDMR